MKYSLAAVALVALSGCANPVVVEFNDREIEFEDLSSASFPEGGLTHMDQERIHVTSDEPINVKRLEARPETEFCIRCKEDQERMEKDFGT